MLNGMTLQDFLSDPDTTSLIVRYSSLFRKYVDEHSDKIFIWKIILGKYAIVYFDRDYYNQLINDLGSIIVYSTPSVFGLMGRKDIEQAGILPVQEQQYLNLRGQGVLLGFVDTGIDYTKAVFRNMDGSTRVRYLYDQTLPIVPGQESILGQTFTKEQIDEALNSENPFNIVPSQDTVGHGTFLASIAGGNEASDFIGAAPDAELIVVKLRGASPFTRDSFLVPPDQQNAYETPDIMLGIDYILEKANELKMPVAICIGLGTNIGEHNGSGILEEYLGTISGFIGVCICTSAGNESQAGHHTMGKLAGTGDIQKIEIEVGENAGGVFCGISNTSSDRISISVTSPTGEIVGRVPARDKATYTSKLILERSKVTVNYFFPTLISGGQYSVVSITDATPGIWAITVYGDIVLNGIYHAYLPITGFISPTVGFLTPDPNYTIVVGSTFPTPITCGAYNARSNSLYINSSWGPTTNNIMSPDLVAPGEGITGFFPSGLGVMSGTSTSAAITTGASALMLQWGIVEENDLSMSTYRIKGYFIRGCVRESSLTYPNTKWGYGRLDLYQTFQNML